MRNVLNYQSSEYDCGPTTLTNALRYLFDRRDLHPEMLKAVSLYTLDAFDDAGESGKSGTSRMAMRFLANWFEQYGRCKRFPISASFYQEEAVALTPNSPIVGCLQQGGVAVVRCWLGGDPHYVLLTRALGEDIGLFDPYAIELGDPFAVQLHAEGVRLVGDEPCMLNRIVRATTLNAQDRRNYAMGAHADREAVLLFNRLTRRTEENAIEYMI